MTASSGHSARPLRILVVDDSVFNRRTISEILAHGQQLEVVGKAANGEEALRLANLFKPDVITLDLEMPRMDGFTFLRILMGTLPTPVIVISSYANKENVFRALELGALDFLAKPERSEETDLSSIASDLLQKIEQVRHLRTLAIRPTRSRGAQYGEKLGAEPKRPPERVVGVAASTGGPSALVEILGRLPATLSSAILIAQHMPEKFTATFAERLDRQSALRVAEARDGDRLWAANVFVCPGGRCLEVENSPTGELRLRVMPPSPQDRYVPSADRLLQSLARVVGKRAVGMVLTGMGDDGAEGSRAILAAGGTVVAESEQTAVVWGMPGAAVRAGAVSRLLPLHEMADFIARLDQ